MVESLVLQLRRMRAFLRDLIVRAMRDSKRGIVITPQEHGHEWEDEELPPEPPKNAKQLKHKAQIDLLLLLLMIGLMSYYPLAADKELNIALQAANGLILTLRRVPWKQWIWMPSESS